MRGNSSIFTSWRGKKVDLLQNTLTLIHHLTHCHSSQSELRTHTALPSHATAGCLNHPLASWAPTSPFPISSSLSLSSPLFPSFSIFLYFVPPFLFSPLCSHLPLFPLPPPLLILFAILLVPVVKEV